MAAEAKKITVLTVPREISSGSRCMSATAASAFLGISVDLLDSLLDDPDEGFPVPFKLGSKRFWTLGSIEAYVRRKERAAEAHSHR